MFFAVSLQWNSISGVSAAFFSDVSQQSKTEHSSEPRDEKPSISPWSAREAKTSNKRVMIESKNYLEAGIVRQLENNGLRNGEKEQQIKQLLTYAYMAVTMYREMSPEDRILASQWHKRFKRSFSFTRFLRERQRSSRKNSFPPAPPYLDKEVQDKDEIISLSPARVKKTLQVRQELFWNELLQYEKKYDRQMLLAFYYYWAEKVIGRRKMKKEVVTSWDTEYRLAAWSKRSFNKNDEAAAIRLERAKKLGKQDTANVEQQKQIAVIREQENAKREAEMEEARKSSISMEEYAKTHPDSNLAKRFLKKERKDV